MGYVGNEPAEKYSSLTQQTFSSPTGTSFTLNQSVTSSVDIALFIDNVRQDPATYTATGTSLTTSTISSPSTMYCLFNGKTTETVAPPANSVDSGNVVSGAIDDSHITGMAASKLTGSVAVANGGTGITAVGTSGNVLTSNGSAWASTAPAGGGAWTLIGTQVASSSASLTQTGLSSTYDTYAIALSDLNPSTDGVQPYFRLGDSSGIDSGGTDYDWSYIYVRSGSSGSFSAQDSEGSAQLQLSPYSVGNASTEGTGGLLYLHRPGDGTMLPGITWHMCDVDNFSRPTNVLGSGAHASAITLDRVQFLFSSGNIDTGRMTVWGLSHD